MIIYDKSFLGLAVLTRIYGSAFPRVLPVAVLTALFTILLGCLDRSTLRAYWIHPFPYQAFSFIVGFILVFRTQYGYQRYWEGCSQFQQMTSKLVDATTLLLAFDSGDVRQPRCEAALQGANRFQAVLLHLVSLVHATASQALRRDPYLSNLTRHSSKQPAPPVDPINIDRNSFKEQNVPLDSAVGQWNSWQDLFMLRASPRHLANHNAALPLPVIGHLSPEEAAALACPAEHRDDELHMAAEGCCTAHVHYMHRPALVMAWLHELLMQRQQDGGLDVPAPILSRAYQTLSDAVNSYDHCRKIATTPFPFPWAQFILVLLVIFTLTCPVLIVAYIRPVWVAVLLSTVTVVTYWATNEVARDIEDPFLYEPNDLPLAKAQYALNDVLTAIGKTRRPPSHMDVNGISVATSSVMCLSALAGGGGSGTGSAAGGWKGDTPSVHSAPSLSPSRLGPGHEHHEYARSSGLKVHVLR